LADKRGCGNLVCGKQRLEVVWHNALFSTLDERDNYVVFELVGILGLVGLGFEI